MVHRIEPVPTTMLPVDSYQRRGAWTRLVQSRSNVVQSNGIELLARPLLHSLRGFAEPERIGVPRRYRRDTPPAELGRPSALTAVHIAAGRESLRVNLADPALWILEAPGHLRFRNSPIGRNVVGGMPLPELFLGHLPGVNLRCLPASPGGCPVRTGCDTRFTVRTVII